MTDSRDRLYERRRRRRREGEINDGFEGLTILSGENGSVANNVHCTTDADANKMNGRMNTNKTTLSMK